ncbi:hypothetical protein AB0F13_13715 [Streptomyces sp. NPDC026206]|uniref:hypothetical protein n=1 Tax=Streptomyces sp. NPDC026206 TaxID=3157089 RepID=UPI0033C82718
MSGAESADHVSVHLTGCGHEDARAVFAALEAAFPEGTGLARSEARAAAPGAGPTIWSMVVDARTRSPREEGAARTQPVTTVTADLFGAADPVRQVREELESAFGVESLGTVPGEHELEVRLRLTSRTDA